MNSERPRKNFKTPTGEPESMNNSNITFDKPSYSSNNYQKSFNSYQKSHGGPSDHSKKIKKPKNKLTLNKFHQPIFRKESEKKQLKKKARDLQRLIEKVILLNIIQNVLHKLHSYINRKTSTMKLKRARRLNLRR